MDVYWCTMTKQSFTVKIHRLCGVSGVIMSTRICPYLLIHQPERPRLRAGHVGVALQRPRDLLRALARVLLDDERQRRARVLRLVRRGAGSDGL